MSHHGPSYSPAYVHDEYDFEDDNDDDLDDERENDEHDESDEDTEEASETDMGKSEEYTEIKEQMYQDKLASLKKQLQQLKDGTHPEYNRKLKKLEQAYRERLRLNIITRDYLNECVERDYTIEKKAAAKEFEEKKIELRETLISDLEEKRKLIESERHTMELTGDSMEVKPVMTRKLRRRPNDPVPIPEKRRKPPPAQLNYLLDEKEIEADLKLISRGKLMGPIRKPALVSNTGLPVTPAVPENSLPDTRIEDGKLLYERRCGPSGWAGVTCDRWMHWTRYASGTAVQVPSRAACLCRGKGHFSLFSSNFCHWTGCDLGEKSLRWKQG